MPGNGIKQATTKLDMERVVATDLPAPSWWARYRLRLRRRHLLWRAVRARHHLTLCVDRSPAIKGGDVLAFSVVRNESARLPYFLEYYRDLGVTHFFMVDNASEDGSAEFLAAQGDVSLWRSTSSYRAARFGLDWCTWLQMRNGHGHWCLTVDADELLVFDGIAEHDLVALTASLDVQGYSGFGAMMLDLYPKGPLDQQSYAPGQDPREILSWFDATPYRVCRQQPLGNLWLQGGVRERVFFATDQLRSPTLNKLPLVKWSRRYAYVNSTHSMLPPHLNQIYSGPGDRRPSGVLLHTKFLPEIVSKSATEKGRGEHFHRPQDFDHYYDDIFAAPNLWSDKSLQYKGPSQLCALGLMSPLVW